MTKNISLFSIGKLISVFGSSIYTFAIGLYVLKLTGSGVNFALTLTFSMVAIIIFNPIAGVLADRFDKKALVVLMDTLNGLLFILLLLLSQLNLFSLTIIYISSFLTTVFTTIFGISMETAKPELVKESSLLTLNSASKILDSASSILGPVMGGLVFAFVDIKLFLLINGISFLISALIELFIDFNYNPSAKSAKSNTKESGFWESFKEGLNYSFKRKDILYLFYIFIAINFFLSLGVTVPLPMIINEILSLPPKSYGFVESFFPVGMILGALLVKKIMKGYSYRQILGGATIAMSFAMLLEAVPLLFDFDWSVMIFTGYFSLVAFIFGLSISLVDIPIIYQLQVIIPAEVRGRVLSIGISFGKIIAPLGLILSGLLMNHILSYVTPIVSGIVLTGSVVIILHRLKSREDSMNTNLDYSYDYLE